MSSAANNPALTGVSDPNPQMISGGTPAQPPPTVMGLAQPWEGDPADNPI